MKLLRMDGGKFEFELSPVEKDLLIHVLNQYPLVPDSHHRLTHDQQIPNQWENQHLLDEAIRTQRDITRKLITTWLKQTDRFTRSEENWRVRCGREDLEWLLQVLNDIRIGSWIALGSPGYSREPQLPQNKHALQNLLRMEIAGGFETLFLGAASGSLTPEPNE